MISYFFQQYHHRYCLKNVFFSQRSDPELEGFGSGFWPKADTRLCTPNKGRFFKILRMNILDNFKSLLFCFPYFWCQKLSVFPIAPDSDPGWCPGSRTSIKRLTTEVWKQKRRPLTLFKMLHSFKIHSPGPGFCYQKLDPKTCLSQSISTRIRNSAYQCCPYLLIRP